MAMRDIYINDSYLDHNPSWHVEDSPWKAKQVLRMMEKNALDVETIAEVGCGAGEILRQMQSALGKGHSFVGYEISPQAFMLAEGRANTSLSFFLEDITHEAPHEYDLFLAIDVIEHVEDYYDFLRKIRPWGRYKIFHIPLDLHLRTMLSGRSITFLHSTVGHLHYFTKESAMQALRDTGYEIVDYFYIAGANELSKITLKRLIPTALRKMFFPINQDLTHRLLGGYSLLVLAQ